VPDTRNFNKICFYIPVLDEIEQNAGAVRGDQQALQRANCGEIENRHSTLNELLV
jgi:hypothetical protein